MGGDNSVTLRWCTLGEAGGDVTGVLEKEEEEEEGVEKEEEEVEGEEGEGAGPSKRPKTALIFLPVGSSACL